jgi:hypothetical protein
LYFFPKKEKKKFVHALPLSFLRTIVGEKLCPVLNIINGGIPLIRAMFVDITIVRIFES